MDVSEFASLGGKARWKGLSKATKKEQMAKITSIRLAKMKARKVIPTTSLHVK